MVETQGVAGTRRSTAGSDAPASAAIGYLLNYLADTSKITGYIPPKHPPIREILDEHGVAGHQTVLPAPKNGFAAHQREAIESYAKTLTYWRNLLVELEWGPKEVVITFTRPAEQDEEEQQGEKKFTLREKLKGKAYRAVRYIGQILVNQGFMVREPVRVQLLTMTERFSGYAIMMKYPGTGNDEAGIVKAYDKWVPQLSDAVARSHEVRTECQKDGQITTIFFTPNRRYVSSLYETTRQFRIFVPHPRTRIDLMFFTKGSYRACRNLAQRYRKDFDITKKPLPAWGVTGHSLVMNYKKGAAGKLVDDSYLYNVRLMTEKLMKRFHLQGSIKHIAETKSLIVTFYQHSADRWAAFGRYGEGIAAITHEMHEEISEQPATL